MFDTICTNCGASNLSPPHYEGRSIKCTTCGGAFIAIEKGKRLFTFHCSSCRGSIEAEEQLQGTHATCPHCNKDIRVVADPPPIPPKRPPIQQAESSFTESSLPDTTEKIATHAIPKMKEYKVLSQKDKWFGGKFDPEKLEQAINSYAAQHWRVISCATAQIPGLTGNREEMIVILERDK